MHRKIRFQHICGCIWEATPSNIKLGKSCPRCNKWQSKGEQRIESFLIKNNINYIREFSVQINGHNLRTDFYLPDYKKHIEFNGIQHYKPIAFFGGEERFKQQCFWDSLKEKYLDLFIIKYLDLEKIEEILALMFNDYPRGVGSSDSKS